MAGGRFAADRAFSQADHSRSRESAEHLLSHPHEGEIDGSKSDSDDDVEAARRRHLRRLNSQRWSCLRCGAKRRPRRSRCLAFLLTTLLLIAAFMLYFYKHEEALGEWWVPDEESMHFSQQPLLPPLEKTFIKNYKLPLRTQGRRIVDAKGKRFKLASVNWYGASDELFVPGGLDIQHRDKIAKTVKRLGFNSVRLPYSDEMVMKNPVVETRDVAANPDLVGLRALDVFEAVVNSLTKAGVAVIVNNHITTATWCCGANPCDAGWANDHLGSICHVKQTEEDWIQHWETIMAPLAQNPLVIGVDLRNEVRGLWGTMPWEKWADAAERCGNRLLEMNKDWLIVVEGTESSNDLSGAWERPIYLIEHHKLVYSAHVYGWSGWGSKEGRFVQRTYDSFVKTMRHNWAYMLDREVAPVWVGEFGAPHRPSVGDAHYWKNLMRFLEEMDADFGYWALNARKPHGNTTETYSLVEDDWLTPVLDYRMKDMTKLMRL